MLVPNRFNLVQDGEPTARPLVFMHGYGCDQSMWRFVAPAFDRDYRVILYDQLGFGRSDVTTWRELRYSSLSGYADDLVELVEALELPPTTVVAHSMAATVAAIAANRRPELFARLVMVCPSPRFMNDPAADYVGGFDEETMRALIDGLDRDFESWAEGIAPAIMGTPDRPELSRELRVSFCRTDVRVAKTVARATFLGDYREEFARLMVPTNIIATTADAIAPPQVGEWLHDAIEGSTLRTLRATGHCPHLSAPRETEHAIWQALAAA
jgi:sigma-B regulation protein RsbQ